MSYNKLIQIDGKVVTPTKRNLITEVEAGSAAAKAGILPGDRLIKINEVIVKDILDYRFLTAAEEFSLTIQRLSEDNTKEYVLHIMKDMYEDLGLSFESGIIDKAYNCSNNCIFCFIDQLPPGMRDTLYFKDDDSRLSFLQGNFVTLTNMTESDINRIIRYRISPINISVHTTNPELRVKMLNNRVAGKLYERMKKLAEAGIRMGAQIVLVPGYNDKDELTRTLQDLAELFPYVTNVAIVPLGMTRYRAGLPNLTPFTADTAAQVIDQVNALQQEFKKKTGSEFARCADEFYCLAGVDIPPEEFYDGYSQLEDGIGMIRMFRESIESTLEDLERGSGSYTFVTGSSAYPEIEQAADKIRQQNPDLTINTYLVPNDFFGHSITVAGLLTGSDIIKTLKQGIVHPHLIMPRNMFRAGEDIMLDGVRIKELEKELATTIVVVDYTGEDLIEKINQTMTQPFTEIAGEPNEPNHKN
ncbi:MAG: DUF512 domain-containing protein [Clostridiaceae bacterium]